INAFITGFLGAGIVWLGLSFKLDLDSSAVLSEKIVMLFPFSDATYLIIASGVVGALCGGLGAITGNSFRQIFIKKKGRGFYEA
ncbi:MAG: hypothetical protein KI790_13970, partial [Cyclobacteriaceae bacterium]|nr:hypothetical protein [Cyclobacteriaceae bacterium HetDA_MAG_MS6]